jgi:hypothetical protein
MRRVHLWLKMLCMAWLLLRLQVSAFVWIFSVGVGVFVVVYKGGQNLLVWSDMLLLLLLLLLGGSCLGLRLRRFCILDLLHALVVEDAVHGLVAAKAAGELDSSNI